MNKPKEGDYRGIHWEWPGELDFLQYCFQLKDRGYIDSIHRAESYAMSDKLETSYEIPGKKKSKEMKNRLLREHVYTPEFIIYWNEQKARDRLIWILGNTKKENYFVAEEHEGTYYSIIEVKPTFSIQNMERLFKINQKWMWDKHKEYVNLIKVNDLFEKTFTPKEFLTTATGKDRKLNWKVKTIDEFLKS